MGLRPPKVVKPRPGLRENKMRCEMRWTCLAILLVAPVFAQVEKTVEQLEAEKRDPKKKAVVLLDNAGQAVGGARPEVQVFGLLHLAENYEPIDKQKSLDFFHQAFATPPSTPADSETNQRAQLQSEIVRSLAPLNVDDAMA